MNSTPETMREDGFSADWLTLRESADHAARNQAVLSAFLEWSRTLGRQIRILDLGCGTGSTLRAVAPSVARFCPGMAQYWTLVDSDNALVARAQEEVRAFAKRDGIDALQVDCLQGDISDLVLLRSLVAETRCHFIAGSALLDLVSAAWLDELAAIARDNGIALFFALNYTGKEVWEPPHDMDEPVLAAFNADQRRDKGFGEALGAEAVPHLMAGLENQGFHCVTGASDWELEGPSPLISALADGIASAAENPSSGLDPAGWLQARRAASHVVIGHVDLFAAPG